MSKKIIEVQVEDGHPTMTRGIDLEALAIEQIAPDRLIMTVGKFDLRIRHTEEGISVDIWDAAGREANELACCYAFDSDLSEED